MNITTNKLNKNLKNIFVLFVIILFLNLPIISALEISNVRAEEITDNNAVVKWETSEPADSFIHYGAEKDKLETLGDANQITSHQFFLDKLTPQKTYFYKVESNSITNDNNGGLYSFTTLAPDTTAPEIDVKFPEFTAGNKLTISGRTEINAKVSIKVNNITASSTIAKESIQSSNTNNSNDSNNSNNSNNIPEEKLKGEFTFADIILESNQANNITIQSQDKAGNTAIQSGTTFADTEKPKLVLGEIPSIIDKNSLDLKANISKKANFEIFNGNKSVTKGEDSTIAVTLNLQEGPNNFKIVVTDKAGNEVSKEFSITADSQPPTVDFKFEKGNEFYQGRAETSINGKTEAGANVYLYVYRPLGYEYNPKFDKARAKVSANEKGEFSFKDVNFESEPISLDTFAPKQVPSGLQQYSIFPIQEVAQQDKFTYNVFVIAEDATGKTGYKSDTITVNSCYSADNAFAVQSIATFQSPFRLDPKLLDSGREVASAVFNLTYKGFGVAKKDLASGAELEKAVQITGVEIDKACTQSMVKDDQFKIGCTILPAKPQKKVENGDKTVQYLIYNLHPSDKLSEKKDDFWNEFKKRQVVFPLKIKISYQERSADGKLSALKTQTQCTDLSYFVDIPIDSKDMLPDFIANQGLTAIDFTIDKINKVMPYLETTIKVVGVGCIGSFVGKMVVKWIRIFTSKLEGYFSQLPGGDKKCQVDQKKMLLQSTRENWQKLGTDAQNDIVAKFGADWTTKPSLDDACPSTTSMWKAEAILDQAYRWTCDRVFCRTAPASWTSTKDKEQVDTVIVAQEQCAITSRGVPLQKIEDCQKYVKENVGVASKTTVELIKNKGAFTCYMNNGKLYYAGDSPSSNSGANVVKLKQVRDFGLSVESALKQKGDSDLIAYQPAGSDSFIVGKDQSCNNYCKSIKGNGYKADTENGIMNSFNGQAESLNGCYKEVINAASGKIDLVGKGNQLIRDKNIVPASFYTADCFIHQNQQGDEIKEGSETGLLQCVCAKPKDAKSSSSGARIAVKETPEGQVEDWDYREAQINRENPSQGVDYPKWRYYGARDRSAAFGADYLLDYLNPQDQKKYHEVNPHSQLIGTFQTLCLSGIRANLLTLQSVLQGLRNCIQEAKVTGLHDAGVCKTLFSQHVCGLIYKSIAYLGGGCSPYSAADQAKSEGGTLDNIGEIGKDIFGSIPQAMQSSVSEIKDDYGNAQLNNFFATGAQGFAQSICMTAFGYDWPMGFDFILDSAYAFATKSTVHVIPAERELATYNPSSGNAIYNYNVGALVLPGCRIKSAEVYLKCVDKDDLGHPGVDDCGQQGCDCLGATQNAQFGNHVQSIEQGRMLNLKPGSMVDFKIPSPQKVDSPFRYDHVVVKLNLDPYEKAENCFDEGYRDGLFYFPITDISPPVTIGCQVQFETGRYFCPSIQALFGGGGAYLEDPYISCFDKNSQTYALCKTPNLFTKGDQIKVKAHVFNDGKKYCVKMSATGLGPGVQELGIKQIPEIPGSFPVEFSLGTVSKEMFSGAVTTLVSTTSSHENSCEEPQIVAYPENALSQKSISFPYQVAGADQYKVQLPTEGSVTVEEPYKVQGNYITLNGKDTLSATETRNIIFNIDTLKVKNLIGSPNGKGSSCQYTITPAAGTGYAQNQKSISVTAELLQTALDGSCWNAQTLVPVSGFGKNKYQENIVLQLEPLISQQASKMHEEFMKGNCQYVQETARSIINRKKSDVEDAVALYYSTACYVITGKSQWPELYSTQVCNLAKIFFDREYLIDSTKTEPYPQDVTSSTEYKKIFEYMKHIKNKANCGGITTSQNPSTPSETTPSIGKTTCGYAVTRGDFAKYLPENWNEYVCRQPAEGELTSTDTLPGSPDKKPQCWSRGMYSTEELAKQYGLEFGCKELLYCCPPVSK